MSGPPYRPIDAQMIPRFGGIRTFMRLPHVTELEGVEAAAIGIPFDTGTSYRSGARFGPEAVRSASALLRPYHPGFGLDLLEAVSTVDYGDLPIAPGDTEGTFRRVEEALAPVVEAGVFPLVIGGDHSITLPELRVLARVHGPLPLVQLDSHTDTWEAYFGQRYFHGTTFKRAAEEELLDPQASVQAGMRGSLYAGSDLEDARALGFRVIPSEELRSLGPDGFSVAVRERAGERPVFLSFDIDFLDPGVAPGTGTPEVAGFSTAEATALLRSLRGIRLAGCDVVEVSPAYDGLGQPTALAAANVLWELLALRAVASPAAASPD
jgi:agmatinase